MNNGKLLWSKKKIYFDSFLNVVNEVQYTVKLIIPFYYCMAFEPAEIPWMTKIGAIQNQLRREGLPVFDIESYEWDTRMENERTGVITYIMRIYNWNDYQKYQKWADIIDGRRHAAAMKAALSQS